MDDNELNARHALARADFFLSLAEKCSASQLEEFEAYLEASIIFARSAMNRLITEFSKHPHWKPWFTLMSGEASVSFFQNERNYILKERSPPLTQIINVNAVSRASELRQFKDSAVDSASFTRSHLSTYATLLNEAEVRFRITLAR